MAARNPSWDDDRRLNLGMFSAAKISLLIGVPYGAVEQYSLAPTDRTKIQERGQHLVPQRPRS